jgi:hypothetical protein
MRVLIIHPTNNYNCGDTLTYLGAVSLLAKAVGRENLNLAQFDMTRAAAEPLYLREYDFGRVDVVAMAGAPWLWIDCAQQNKYRILFDARQRFPHARFIALGLGSMFQRHISEHLTNGGKDHFFNSPADCERLTTLYRSFQLIATRDCMARHIFERLGVSCYDTFDSSIFAQSFRRTCKGERAVLFFYDAGRIFGGKFLDFPAHQYLDAQLQWAAENKADIFVNCPEDGEVLTARGIPYEISVDLEYLAEQFCQYNRMLSGRVHMAVLGKLAGIPDVTLLPIDTRYLTATRLGIVPQFVGQPYIHPQDELTFSWEAVEQEEGRLVEMLRNALGVST